MTLVIILLSIIALPVIIGLIALIISLLVLSASMASAMLDLFFEAINERSLMLAITVVASLTLLIAIGLCVITLAGN
jgi:hypothetical protein